MKSLFVQSPLQKKVSLAFGLFSVAFFIAYAVYLIANRDAAFGANSPSLVAPLMTMPFFFIAILLCYRRPENAISWLLLIVAILLQTNYLAAPMAIARIRGLEPTLWLVFFANLWPWLSGLIATILAYVFVLFPTGRLPSPRWRLVIWLLLLQVLITVGRSLYLTIELSQAFSLARQGISKISLIPLSESGPSSQILHTREFPAMAQLTYVIAFIALVMVLLGLWALLNRYRWGNPLERQQVKWIIFALGFWGASIVLIVGDFGIPVVAFAFIFPVISAAIAVAILRYRLYDIDIIIRRTLTYSMLTAILAGVYFGSVILLQSLFRSFTGDSPLAIVISTLLIAALFSPLRRKVQAFIDRRFYRAKYDAAHALDEFARTARDEVELEALAAELLRVVEQTVQPESVSLWLKKERERT